MYTKAELFYFYSHTDRRCVIQRKTNSKPAWVLEFVGTASNEDDLYAKAKAERSTERYLVTTEFGKLGDREKVQSRELPGLFDAISWASFVQTQNPRKTVNLWKIIKENI